MTPEKKKHLVVSLVLSALTLFFAYIYIAPTPKKKETPTLQTEINSKTNYDSILTNLLQDTNSHFRKSIDSIYKQPQKKYLKEHMNDTLKLKTIFK